MLGKDRVWRRVGGVSDSVNINKWNQSTLFSRMIDFWKTDILTKWQIPYVTMVGRRQFNIPISSEMVIFLPGHLSFLKIMIHSNFFAVGQTRYSCSFRFLCARLHTVIIRFLHLIFAKVRQPLVVVYKFSQSRDTFFRSGLLKTILQMPVTLCLL